MAEELGLEQRLGKRAAVERHHRLLAPQRVEMNRLRDQTFARTRLAREQDRAVGSRHGLDHLEHLQHRLAAPDDVRELVRQSERPLQQDVLLPKLAVLDLLANLHLQQIDVEGLAQIVAGAEPHRLDGGVGRRERGDHDAEDVLVDALRGAQHLDAAEVRHLDIGNQQVDRFAFERVDGSTSALGEQHLVSLAPQHDREQLAHRPLIVHHQDAWRTAIGRSRRRFGSCGHVSAVARAGSRTDTVVPTPGCELTWISPL